MAPLKNQRHELFAQGLAKGLSADQSYAEAGYEPHRGNASRMSANQNIRKRMAELQERAAARTIVTIESLTRELDEALALAMKDPKGTAAAVSAIMGKAKLNGLLVDKSEAHNTNYHITDAPMTPEEWERQYVTEH